MQQDTPPKACRILVPSSPLLNAPHFHKEDCVDRYMTVQLSVYRGSNATN